MAFAYGKRVENEQGQGCQWCIKSVLNLDGCTYIKVCFLEFSSSIVQTNAAVKMNTLLTYTLELIKYVNV
jgi:hypothetical protein